MTKNEALAGEPVTWGVDWSKDGDIPCVSIIKRLPDGGIEVLAVEYGPQRPWVGLSDEDITKIDQGLYPTWKDEVQAVEARLKELNTCQE